MVDGLIFQASKKQMDEYLHEPLLAQADEDNEGDNVTEQDWRINYLLSLYDDRNKRKVRKPKKA